MTFYSRIRNLSLLKSSLYPIKHITGFEKAMVFFLGVKNLVLDLLQPLHVVFPNTVGMR